MARIWTPDLDEIDPHDPETRNASDDAFERIRDNHDDLEH
jgi:hypothetical protein